MKIGVGLRTLQLKNNWQRHSHIRQESQFVFRAAFLSPILSLSNIFVYMHIIFYMYVQTYLYVYTYACTCVCHTHGSAQTA